MNTDRKGEKIQKSEKRWNDENENSWKEKRGGKGKSTFFIS